MNEAFKKILERLEEEQRKQDEKCRNIVVKDGHSLEYEFHNGKSISYKHAKEIVQEVAEAYNNGWIPCSERMPTAEEYQRGNGRFLVTDGNRTYEAEFDIYESHTFGKSRMASDWFVTDKRVTHWQNEPLPEPYHPKESEKHGM